MSPQPWRFTASVTNPSEVRIDVTITSPPRTDVEELAEVAQMAASHAAGIIRNAERVRTNRANREILADLYGRSRPDADTPA